MHRASAGPGTACARRGCAAGTAGPPVDGPGRAVVHLLPRHAEDAPHPRQRRSAVEARRHAVPAGLRGAAVEVRDRVGRQVAREHRHRPDHLRSRPDRQLGGGGIDESGAERGGGGVRRTGGDGDAGPQTEEFRGRGRQVSGRVRRAGEYRRELAGVEAEGVQDLQVPAVVHDVVQQGRGGVAGFGAELGGEARTKPVLRRQRPPNRCVHLGLVPSHPGQQRARHTRAERAGQPGTDVGGKLLVRPELVDGTRVRPEHGGADGRSLPVHGDDAVHLSGQADGEDVGLRLRQRRPHRCGRGGHHAWGRSPTIPDGDCSPGSHRRSDRSRRRRGR